MGSKCPFNFQSFMLPMLKRLEGHWARKGVMLTTSTSQEAKDYVQKIERKIVLIDGKQPAQLMIEHDVSA
jgi:restriction endonuclease Mrr